MYLHKSVIFYTGAKNPLDGDSYNVPGYTSARLAIDVRHQRQGLAEVLFMAAMQRIRAAALAVGGGALFVDVKETQALDFYKKIWLHAILV